MAIFAERMLAGRPIEIHGDGLQTRDFVYVDDVASAVLAASRAESGAAVNIGTGHQTTILELCELMAASTGFTGDVTHVTARAGDVRHSALDPSAAARALGWRPAVDLVQGIERTVAWYRNGAWRGLRGRRDVADQGPAEPTGSPTRSRRGVTGTR